MEGCGYFLTILAFYLSSLDYFFCSLLINGILRIQKEKKSLRLEVLFPCRLLRFVLLGGLFSRLLVEVFFWESSSTAATGANFFW